MRKFWYVLGQGQLLLERYCTSLHPLRWNLTLQFIHTLR